jgi:hypothetical protein
MRNVSDTSCRENQNTHFVFSNFFSENRAFMRKRGKNITKRGRPQVTIWRMCIVCWMLKTTNTHTQVVQYWLPFHSNNGRKNAPQCYVIRTLPVLFLTVTSVTPSYLWPALSLPAMAVASTWLCPRTAGVLPGSTDHPGRLRLGVFVWSPLRLPMRRLYYLVWCSFDFMVFPRVVSRPSSSSCNLLLRCTVWNL